MVNDTGQLYTIEGVAAGLIMLLTVYFVFNTTSVYTPGDAHISDMQMEVLGSDALRMMDTPPSLNSSSPLVGIILQDNGEQFKTMFSNYTDNRTLLGPDAIKFTASYTCRDCNGNCADPNLLQQTESFPITSNRNFTGGEHAVRVTKWVIVNKRVCDQMSVAAKDRAVLVEVLMWRD